MNRSIVLRISRTVRVAVASFIGLLSGGLGFGWAAAAEGGDSPLIEVEARFVHVTKTQAWKALGDSAGQDATTSELTPEQTRKALEMLVRLKADFFSRPRLVVQTGRHAVAETVREMRYPTQFDPSLDEPGKLLPVAFETRNVGVTLDVDASSENGGIHLSVVPKVVRFLGFIIYDGKKDVALKEPEAMAQLSKRRMTKSTMWQPVFAFQQMTKKLPVGSDEVICLCELQNDPVRKELGGNDVRTLVFIKARSLPVKDALNAPQPVSP